MFPLFDWQASLAVKSQSPKYGLLGFWLGRLVFLFHANWTVPRSRGFHRFRTSPAAHGTAVTLAFDSSSWTCFLASSENVSRHNPSLIDSARCHTCGQRESARRSVFLRALIYRLLISTQNRREPGQESHFATGGEQDRIGPAGTPWPWPPGQSIRPML